jgi:CubicO group peptidase (beta-lactamase class C family)
MVGDDSRLHTRESAMNRRELIAAAAMASSIVSGVAPARAKAAESRQGASLNDMLTPYLSRYQLPALAAAVFREGQVVASGAVGVRRAGTDTPVTINDAFHIGSDTKAMTSLLAGMMVEEDKLQWSSTIGGSFPELAATMDAGLRDVTLEQLLSHTSGIPSDNDAFGRLLFESFTQDGLNLDELRFWLAKGWSNQPLVTKPGTTFAYSNMGYTIAGAMIERAAKTTWEEMVVQRVFIPLRLETAGFGPQASVGRVNATLGHLVRGDGSLKPILAGPDGDNPLIIGPAGTVHLSILDFAAWGGWQAGEGRRGPGLVRPETLKKLHSQVIAVPAHDAPPGTPPTGYYCLGWGIATMPFAPEPFLTHSGSNNMNLATIMLRPEQDYGMVIATNVAGTKADAALKEAGADIYGSFGPK